MVPTLTVCAAGQRFSTGARYSAGRPSPRLQSLAKTIDCEPSQAGVSSLQNPLVKRLAVRDVKSCIQIWVAEVAEQVKASSRLSGETEGEKQSSETSVCASPPEMATDWIDR